ncbi:MAG TPA: helix-turn-helix transcriptional regulator [Pyrinomonadaceae bacterium]|jgi:transcriptional regulator with XRE-family HTH domain
MGKASRRRPSRLAEKLLQIRNKLSLSQNEMLRRLGISEEGYRNYISDFENGKREPDLLTLLAYARCFGISTDVLIDDSLDLPQRPRKRSP